MHTSSATRNLEVSFDALIEPLQRIGYLSVVEAHAEGIRTAGSGFGMTGRLIAAIDCSGAGEQALGCVHTVVEDPHEYVAGIGLDNLEAAGPPERFADGRPASVAQHPWRRASIKGRRRQV